MRQMSEGHGAPGTRRVPERARPSEARAAAAARLAGATANADSVRRRMAEAARRAEEAGGRAPVTRLAARRPSRPAAPAARASGPVPGRARAMANPSASDGMIGAAGLAAVRAEPVREEESRPRHLKVVRPGTLSAAQRRRRARAVLIASIGAASVIAFALVYLHVVLAQRQFRIDHLNSQVSKAQTSYQNLRLQVAELGSPQHIISTAEGSLGMVQPSKVVYLTPSPAASTPSSRTSTSPKGTSSASSASAVRPASQAPAGDANWPVVKSQLAGTP